MSFWELLALAGTMATILGIFLTIYALINNKTLKEEARLTRESIEASRRETRESIEASREETRRLLEKMDSRLEKMDSTLKYIADLIVSEGRKTRDLIKT